MNLRINSYIKQFNQIFDGAPWLDETFIKKIEPLIEEQVFYKPYGNYHSVAELVSHVYVWRMEVIRRLTLNISDRLLTVDSPENWKNPEELKTLGWKNIYSGLVNSQNQLIRFLKDKEDDFLSARQGNSEWDNEYFIAGLLHHDIYHLGQIGLIIRMLQDDSE